MALINIGSFWKGKTKDGTPCLNGELRAPYKGGLTLEEVLLEMAASAKLGEKIRVSLYVNKRKDKEKSPDYGLVWKKQEQASFQNEDKNSQNFSDDF